MSKPPSAATKIRIIYPRPQHLIYEDATFVMGGVAGAPTGAKMMLKIGQNGEWEDVPLSKHGYFAYKLPIHTGQNPFHLKLLPPGSSGPPLSEELIALYGVPPLSVLPPLPLTVHEETLSPSQDVWLSPDDTLTVAVSASTEAEVRVTFPYLVSGGSIPWQPLTPAPIVDSSDGDSPGGLAYVDTRETIFAQPHWTQARIPLKGYYQARIPASELFRLVGPVQDAPLVLALRHGTQELKKPLTGRMTLLAAPRPAILKDDRVVTRTAPESGARLTPQRAGTLLMIDGLERGWARARLSRDEAFYVPLESLAFPETRLSAEPLRLESIQCTAEGVSAAALKLNFSGNAPGACPIRVESLPIGGDHGPVRLQVRLYGVCSQCDFIHYPPQNPQEPGIVRQVHWRQVTENVLELWIDLARPLAGYDYELRDGAWYLHVKTLPHRLEDVRILIDPGHGGTEIGSTGLNGLPEKDLNLTVSHLLQSALRSQGFTQVSLSRNSDVTLSLQGRTGRVLAEQADIVLSIHHNALPDGRDPLAAEGACTFYYHAFSKPLAEQILASLTHAPGDPYLIPSYGLFYDSLHMTRIHQAIAVLVEIGFFTNPAEFERLIEPDFQQEAARRIAHAVQLYVQGAKG